MIRITDLPDDTGELANWLERQLVELDVQDLVGELQALSPRDPDWSVTMESVLGEFATQVAHQGFRVLDLAHLQSFIRHPHVLLEIRDWLFDEGGEYWIELSENAAHHKKASAALARAKQQVEDQNQLNLEVVSDQDSQPVSATKPDVRPESNGRPIRQSSLFGVLAVAATILIAVGIWHFGATTDQVAKGGGWGFDSADLMTQEATAAEYLLALSKAAEQWSNKTPTDSSALANRLAQFSAGCQKLIEAPHRQLSNEDADWLRTKCTDWQQKLDDIRVRLIAGDLTFENATTESNQAIDKLIDALSQRSQTV